jgi:hypothetical protein
MPHKGERPLNGIKEKNEPCTPEPRGALAMLGFAKRFRPTRTTEEWIAELRDADSESDG